MSGMKDDDDPTPTKRRAQYKFGDLQQSKSDTSRQSKNPLSKGGAAHDSAGNKPRRTTTLGDQSQIAEESRLLGSPYSSSRSDPNAVAIFSRGSTMRTKTHETFKPRDTLTTPLDTPRAVLNDHNAINRTKTNLSHLELPESAVEKIRTSFHDKDDLDRPRKKQKVATPAGLAGDVIEIDDDDDTKSRERAGPSEPKPTSPVGHKLRQPSSSGRRKSKAQKSASLKEFWDVEGQVDPRHSQPKKKRDRVERHGDTDELDNKEISTRLAGTKAREDREKRTSLVMSAVEVPATPNKTKSREEVNNSSNNLQAPSARSGGQHRDNDARESPDELQGEKTVSDSWKLRAGVEKRTSPSDIQPTQFSPGTAKSNKNGGRPGHHTNKKRQLTCRIDLFRHDRTITQQPLELTADKERGTFSVKAPNDLIASEPFDLSRVNSVLHSEEDGSTKMRFQFPKSQGSSQNTVDVQFTEVIDKRHFLSIVRKVPNAKIYEKPKNWMGKAFEKRGLIAADTDQATGPKQQNERQSPVDNTVTPQSPKHKRQKLSENLQNGNGPSHVGQMQHSGVHDSPTRRNSSKSDRPLDLPSHAHPSPEYRESGGITIPVKTFQGAHLTKRETRSQRKQQQNFTIDSDEERIPTSIPSVIRNTRWAKPLVYPKTGKKKAEVEAQDLERLRDSEFLNDNLIGFYIRFLEYHLERTRPDLAKRMYFFNSYFFATLTNTPRGVRGINYQAVQKWTRAVDIFSYDYVVVPINESAHWYIAIICNLPSLIHLVSDEGNSAEDTREDADPPKEPIGGQESPPPRSAAVSEAGEAVGSGPLEPHSESSKDNHLPQSFRSMTLSHQPPASSKHQKDDEPPIPTERECSDKEDWPDEDENQPSALPTPRRPNQEEATTEERQGQTDGAAKSGKASISKKKRYKKSRPPVQKYDPKQPIIITFDSLGCTRSLTSRALREYLEEEGKSKRSITFDGKVIKSMTAKQIPLQPNFSDCGLYLLAYLEKFILDPDTFATKLLRKEMSEHTDWPRLRSGELRRRLLRFILDLYEEQNGDKGKEHGGGPWIVDTRPLHILLRDEEPAEDRDQMPKPAPLGDWQSSGCESRPATPKQMDRETREKTDHPEQPSIAVRSSPRPTHTEEPLEKDRPASPVVAIEQPEPEKVIKQEGTELLGQLEAAIQQAQGSPHQRHEPCIPETPPPDDGNMADDAVSQIPSAGDRLETK